VLRICKLQGARTKEGTADFTCSENWPTPGPLQNQTQKSTLAEGEKDLNQLSKEKNSSTAKALFRGLDECRRGK